MAADRNISRIIYALKRERGVPALVQRESITTNLTTGETITHISDSHSLSRVVLLPKKITTDFAYDLSFVAANKNFTYGGLFNKTDRYLFVDARDLGTFVMRQDSDVIVIGARRYQIKEIEEYDEAGKVVLYIVTARDLGGQPNVQS